MHGRLAVLGPADVQRGIPAPFDLRPFQVAHLDRPQAMPEGGTGASLDFSYPYYAKACGGACKRDSRGDEK
jgi:hypothetical protein